MDSWTDHVEAMIRNVLSEGSEEKKNNAIASVLRVMMSELLRLQGSHKDLQAKDANSQPSQTTRTLFCILNTIFPYLLVIFCSSQYFLLLETRHMSQ